MELSYSPLSSLTIARPIHQLSRPQTQKPTRKSCNINTICSLVSPSPRFHSYNRRSSSKNISTKHYKLNFIRACTQAGSDPITTRKGCSFGEACWRFIRPYSFNGIVIAAASLLARAVIQNPNLMEWSLVFKAFSGLFILTCLTISVNGINQIYDMDIDKVNKPYLPIVAGDLSVKSAWLLVVFFAVAGLLVVGLTCGPLLTGLYIVGLFFGIAYSVPPFRFKSFPAGTILTLTLGFLLNFSVYYSLRGTLGLAFQWSPPLIYITAFGIVMGLMVSTIKDLSDVEGDAKFGISTLAIKFGVRNVAYLGCGIMLAYYAATLLASIYMPQSFNPVIVIPTRLLLALSLIYQTRVLEEANYNSEASLQYYMVIWNLYYAEYILFPFI